MKDKEILEKAIEIAIKNGYKEPFVFGMGSSFSLDKFQIFKLYFSHDFAKAFWGTKQKDTGYEEISGISGGERVDTNAICIEAWKYHLQQMVLEEKPIDYLRKFIDTTENPTNDESSVVDKIEDDTINFSPVIFKNGKYKTNNQDIITAMTHKYKEVPCCAVCENTMIVYPVNSARPYCNICDDLVDEGTTKILI